tara:strand:+ start:7426 stop:7860 length:435 start_codon:yes stop_codon:yes gene_type:complete
MNYYLLFKALHLISMVAWFAGLFYMFRLFVYHTENQDKPEVVAVLKTMSRKLFHYITTPAMIATFLFGFLLLLQVPYQMKTSWFMWKFLLLIALGLYHYFIGHTLGRYAKDDIFLTSKQCRLWNEAPTILLIAIVFLAVFKPFS